MGFPVLCLMMTNFLEQEQHSVLFLGIRLGSEKLSDNFAQQINDSGLDFFIPNPDRFFKHQIAPFVKYRNLV